ncbi:hypothetical protein [Aeromicrobium sp. UC242_57]|uniref:hypothetical protein n=1 Tax=Aeromicrobium sp. UC242_57 TaxID=3374624 RepID=UPI0037B01E97
MAHIVLPFDEVGPPHVWTIDDLARLPDDERRFEIVDGQLMMVPPPSFGHQAAAKKLQSASDRCLR